MRAFPSRYVAPSALKQILGNIDPGAVPLAITSHAFSVKTCSVQSKCFSTAIALQLNSASAHLYISRQIASRKSSSGKPAVKVLTRRKSPGSPEISINES